MKLRSISLVGLVLFVVGAAGFGQVPVSGPGPAVGAVAGPAVGAVEAPVDIYANFVGTWVGTSRVLQHGVEVTQPLRVEVTEDAKKQHLRFFYAYGWDAREGFEYVTRVVTLDPSKGQMTWVETDNPRAPDAVQHTAGLDAFAKTGFGVFNAGYEFGDQGHQVANRCMYVLNSDLFSYVWYESVDGKPFALYSVTQLTREHAARASVSKP